MKFWTITAKDLRLLVRDRRALMTVSLAVVVGTALWITIDLDQPRAGVIQLDDSPLKALARSLS